MLTVELPWPSSQLSPNARIHWAVRARAVKAARQCAKMQTLELTHFTRWRNGPALVTLEFYPPSGRKFDMDNLIARCKSYLDGIADALEVNDNDFWMNRPVRGEVVKGGKVIVKIGE